jgi:hypothetical protein
MPAFTGASIEREVLLGAFAFLHHNASDCNEDPVDVPGATRDLLCAWSPELSMRMVQAVAESGAVPDMPWWNDAEVDPQTGELVDQPAPTAAPAAPVQAAAVDEGAAAEDAEVHVKRPVWLLALPIAAGVLLLALVVGWLVMRARMEK